MSSGGNELEQNFRIHVLLPLLDERSAYIRARRRGLAKAG